MKENILEIDQCEKEATEINRYKQPAKTRPNCDTSRAGIRAVPQQKLEATNANQKFWIWFS